MSEYIKREDALAKVERVDDGDRRYRIIYAQDIESIPAADVVERTENTVEVVRCKDCYHGTNKNHGYVFCGKVCDFRPSSFFCASGERKDGDAHV